MLPIVLTPPPPLADIQAALQLHAQNLQAAHMAEANARNQMKVACRNIYHSRGAPQHVQAKARCVEGIKNAKRMQRAALKEQERISALTRKAQTKVSANFVKWEAKELQRQQKVLAQREVAKAKIRSKGWAKGHHHWHHSCKRVLNAVVNFSRVVHRA